MPRSYLANVVYTIVGDAFQDWANAKIDARNAKVVQDKEMGIQMDPEIAALFRASSSVSGKCVIKSRIQVLCFYYLISSFKGYFQSFNEGYCKEKTIQKINQRGQ